MYNIYHQMCSNMDNKFEHNILLEINSYRGFVIGFHPLQENKKFALGL